MKKQLIILFQIICIYSVFGEIKFPSIISDNMVLQQEADVLLWGESAPNENVVVVTSWDKKEYQIKATTSGEWQVKVKTLSAGGPYEISVVTKTDNKVLKNVLLGEVWLCGGQSNMDMGFRGLANQPLYNAADEILDSNYPQLRFFRVKRDFNLEPQKDCRGNWQISNTESAEIFSAVGFLFGRQLHKQLNVPVGMIACTWGGSKVEAWMSKELLEQFMDTKLPWEVTAQNANRTRSVLFNAMVKPIAGYNIKGCIFYQGEANVTNPDGYAKLFPAMVDEWRTLWKSNFPFYYVQLAPFPYTNMGWNSNGTEAAKFREAQHKAMKNIPNSGMVSLTDVGDEYSIHAPDKVTVAKRLLYWAYANAYNKKGFEFSAPVYKSVELQKGQISVYFDNAKYGLSSYGKELVGFEIAGDDKVFYPAKAILQRDPTKVVLTCDKVQSPVAVRYCFKNYSYGNLYNNSGIAAYPFRTDNWE